jgi:MFS transporter, SP family, arabinose:H+ symporter
MNSKLILWSITVGLGGFLFGLDTAVISGAVGDIEKLWNLDKLSLGFTTASALYGTVFGAAFGGVPADYFGRKKVLLYIGILFLVSAIGAALAKDVNIFMLFRFIGGLSIGASSVVAPVYISEIAPPKYRGRMVISFQFNIVFGILIAYISNYLFDGFDGGNDWRWMMGVVALPSLIYSIMVLFTPESPRWLITKKGDEEAARKVLAITEPDVDAAMSEIKKANLITEVGKPKESFFSKKYQTPILLAFLFAFFNQLSGINAIIYFAPEVFKMTGLAQSGALLSTAGIGVVNLIFTIFGWYLIDKLGRKTLMYIGSFGYIASLALIAYAFFTNGHSITTYYIFAFIAAHAVGQGAVIWVFISEIFPNSVRASGMAWGSLTHWVFAAILTNVFPILADKYGAGPIFAFFSLMMVLQLLYVHFMMPETKGVSLEDLQKKLVKG